MVQKVFPDWSAAETAAWSKRPMRLAHTLHLSPLFTNEALAALIERYPEGAYGLINTGANQEKRLWREGRIGNMPGHKVMEAIGSGGMWLNLRHASDIDPAYDALLDQMFSELRGHLPGFNPFWRSMGILISSPNARVHYHADMPGQALGQIRGRKRVYVYPAEPPYLTQRGVENIARGGNELDIEYRPEFDAQAQVFDAEPGQLFHWPLNAPHRVENFDCLNVSFTVEFLTPDIRRHQIVSAANGLLRQKLGVSPSPQTTAGPRYWAKAALNAGARRAERLTKPAAKRRPVTFTLDPAVPGFIRDLNPAAE